MQDFLIGWELSQISSFFPVIKRGIVPISQNENYFYFFKACYISEDSVRSVSGLSQKCTQDFNAKRD